MSSPAEPPPPEHPPTPAPAPAPASPPPHPAASGNEAAAPPKPNPPITPAPGRNASAAPPSGSPATAAAAAPVPSRKESGSTSAAAPAAATRKASGVAAATTGVLPRKPPGTTAPVAARNIPATTAASRTATRATTTTTATSVSRRPAAAAAAVASRIPLRATDATTTHAASRNPLTGAAAATATATVAAVGRGGFRAAPTRPEEYTPRMGMEFESEHEAYEFYRYYGWKVGFNVRKEYANKSKKTGEITSRKFACSREGYRANVKRGNHMVPMPDSRTGCNAHLVIRRKKPGAKLEVYAFQPRHNHPLFATSCMPNPLQPNVVHWTTLLDAVTPPDLLMDGENIMDKSSGTTAKESKKKGQKNKIQSRNCIEKGLRKKQKVHSEQPSEYALLGGSQSGNMFQAFEGPPNMSPLGTQTPTYKTYRGIDLSSPMGPISYDEMPSGLDPTFTTVLQPITLLRCQVAAHTTSKANVKDYPISIRSSIQQLLYIIQLIMPNGAAIFPIGICSTGTVAQANL
uniref:FAR1 domain-containing protein n=1 Tax=Oryza nivara TaxID=4536 RepID=A0A0E0H0Q4_ORYNI